MKLSISMIVDRLGRFEPQCDIKKDEVEIETVRLYSGSIERQPRVLYVGRGYDFEPFGGTQVILCHQEDRAVLNTNDLQLVLNEVLDAVENYFAWWDRLLRLLSGEAMLQNLVDASEHMIKHPLFLLDAGQRLLAFSQNYTPDKSDSFWWNMMANKMGNVDVLSFLNQKYYNRFDRIGIYQLDEPELFPSLSYHYNFFCQKSWVGMLTLLDAERNLTRGEKHVLEIFCSVLERWFEAHIEDDSTSAVGAQLKQALTSEQYDTYELKMSLALWGWSEDDQLILLKLDAPYTPYNINLHLCRVINQNRPAIFAFGYNTSIAVLCNVSLTDWEKKRRELQILLKSSHYYGSCSPLFTLKDSMSLYYKYASLTSEFCGKQAGEIYDGAHYRMEYMLTYVNNGSLPDPSHPALLQLREYDQRHHTDYAHTLKVYLEKERNHVATAQELSLHRNSLGYRINKIQSLIETNLDDPKERLHLLLSFALLENKIE